MKIIDFLSTCHPRRISEKEQNDIICLNKIWWHNAFIPNTDLIMFKLLNLSYDYPGSL